ncbi:hypothetical protein WG922_14930 [Ramlibacter sp. AN1015]|uniref:hypothetical protein n=1 Tax=Ramlibacter sp. AN1015 TaxID=3133428 RepID=UPI0030BED47C
MSLLKRLFGDKTPAQGASRFQDSETSAHAPSSRSVPRREVVHVVLRETMRQHGIPNDWIECRTLNLVQANTPSGTYVTLVVKRGQDRLLPYVPAFQASFREALARFDPRAAEWLRAVAWEFDEAGAAVPPMPPVGASIAQAAPADGIGTAVGVAPLAAAAAAAQPGERPITGEPEEDDVQADLRALFAIRDAALSGQAAPADAFKPTEHGGL